MQPNNLPDNSYHLVEAQSPNDELPFDVDGDLYAILGVHKRANTKEIKKAYYRLAMKYHPDQYEGDKRVFQAIVHAYTVLTDEGFRALYDAKRYVRDQEMEDLGANARSMLRNILESVFAREPLHNISGSLALTKIAIVLKNMRKALRYNLSITERELKKIERVRKTIKVKPGKEPDNFLTGILDTMATPMLELKAELLFELRTVKLLKTNMRDVESLSDMALLLDGFEDRELHRKGGFKPVDLKPHVDPESDEYLFGKQNTDTSEGVEEYGSTEEYSFEEEQGEEADG